MVEKDIITIDVVESLPHNAGICGQETLISDQVEENLLVLEDGGEVVIAKEDTKLAITNLLVHVCQATHGQLGGSVGKKLLNK